MLVDPLRACGSGLDSDSESVELEVGLRVSRASVKFKLAGCLRLWPLSVVVGIFIVGYKPHIHE